jgi:hypothetical protein
MQVNFLICGAQKAGTTSLDSYCRHHQEIGMPEQKELHFFDNDALFLNGEPDFERYHQAFPQKGNRRIFGETTPIYMYWPDVPERIHRYNPDMRLIVLLRNPVDRAYSHWQMESARGLENLTFGEAIRAEDKRLAEASMDHQRIWSYVDRGYYLAQLRRLWTLFGKEQVLVLESDSLRQEPASVLSRISGFLGVSLFPVTGNLSMNVQAYQCPMSEPDRQYLRECFAGEIDELERELGWDLNPWRN